VRPIPLPNGKDAATAEHTGSRLAGGIADTASAATRDGAVHNTISVLDMRGTDYALGSVGFNPRPTKFMIAEGAAVGNVGYRRLIFNSDKWLNGVSGFGCFSTVDKPCGCL
jgi:hypothetical protein